MGWVLLLVFFALVAGKGARFAFSAMQANEELRKRMKESLDDCELKLAAREEQNKRLMQDSTLAHRKMMELTQELESLRNEVHWLTVELARAREHNAELLQERASTGAPK